MMEKIKEIVSDREGVPEWGRLRKSKEDGAPGKAGPGPPER